MRFSVSTVIVSFAALAFAADPLVLNTPASVTQCEETLITWQGGVGTEISFEVEDSTGVKAPSASLVVQPSTQTGCL
ncbi:hypothetical protein C8Q78DRAFT_1077642 [Trametes maxima]|nr:hypothetical protein C8Q78DRAFT_1077642 [Trametes maxima]